MRRVVCIFVSLLAFVITKAQTALCPPNIDFEENSFNHWNCYTGKVDWVNGNNVVTWTGFAQTNNRHTIIPSSDVSTDEFGGFPVSCPNGSGFSVKLGNPNAGAEAEGISYTYNIPSNVNHFVILYYYAVVFEDPPSNTNHATAEKPRFQARVINTTTNTELGCVTFDFYSSYGLPGFQVSPKSTVADTIIYKDWTPITLDLGQYAGQTIKLEFTTSDCTRGGHFGYAYVDVNSNCNNLIAGATVCSGNTSLNMHAPYGFQSYTWYSDLTYSQVIATGANAILSPAPPIGSILPVIVVPYPTFGCVDTIFANITTANSPVAVAGPDRVSCDSAAVQLGAPPLVNHIYQWAPSWLVNGTTSSNPTTKPLTDTTDFILQVTDLVSGCISFDTARVVTVSIDTMLFVTGKLNYCEGEPVLATLTATANYSTIQWYNNNIAISGANNNVITPQAAGTYWALIHDNVCVDSSSIRKIQVYPKPVTGISLAGDTQCVTSNSFAFHNTSSITDGSALTYTWLFGNGDTSHAAQPVKTYPGPGDFLVSLFATSVNGCTDTAQQPVRVVPNAEVDFSFNTKCIEDPVIFSNLSDEHGSISVRYQWDFGDGLSSSLRDPLPVQYIHPGSYDVILKAVAAGCELYPQSTSKRAGAHAGQLPVRYHDVLVPINYPFPLSAREIGGVEFEWQPAFQLSDAHVQSPVFNGNVDMQYIIRITDSNYCKTADTLKVIILKKNGVYVPTAFTPNGDGINDILRPHIVGMKNFKRFAVYNRLGNMVYATDKYGEGWDGRWRGSLQEAGTFAWSAEYFTTGDQLISVKGYFVLLR